MYVETGSQHLYNIDIFTDRAVDIVLYTEIGHHMYTSFCTHRFQWWIQEGVPTLI